MANTPLTSLFTDIARAIREKTGGTNKIVATAFPEAIRGIVLSTPDTSGEDDTLLLWSHFYNRSFDIVTSATASHIGPAAFAGCRLTSLSFPSCTVIEAAAFYNCTELSAAEFPACTFIGSKAFDACYALASINFPLCSFICDYAFNYCRITFASLPAVSTVGCNAFASCYKLTSVSLPACRTVSEGAFERCSSLTTISLPVCSYIGSWAFNDCIALSKITLKSAAICTLYDSSAFTDTKITATTGSICVPASLVASYKAASAWSYFKNRIFGV